MTKATTHEAEFDVAVPDPSYLLPGSSLHLPRRRCPTGRAERRSIHPAIRPSVVGLIVLFICGILCCETGKERKKIASQPGVVAGIVMAILVAISAVGLVVFFAVRRAAMKGSESKAPTTSEEENSSTATGYQSKLLADARYISQTVKLGALGIPLYRSFSLVELEAATNNFENSYLLGQDSHGEMYRGRLDNGTPVTIRTLNMKRSQTTQIINGHIETISRVRHQNLVSALGHCFEYDLSESTVTQLYIVFEYVQNGNLRSRISQGTPSSFTCRWVYFPMQYNLSCCLSMEMLGCNEKLGLGL